MKTTALLFFSLSVVLLACSTEEGITNNAPLWGIEFSNESTSTMAMGSIDRQNEGPRVTYVASAGNLKQVRDNAYQLSFTFEGGDVLVLDITKHTPENDYHFPGVEGENQLVSATFNGTVLNLSSSVITILPRTGENKFYTVTDLHTIAGTFNGNVGRVPLVR